jgi:hypothetical protein
VTSTNITTPRPTYRAPCAVSPRPRPQNPRSPHYRATAQTARPPTVAPTGRHDASRPPRVTHDASHTAGNDTSRRTGPPEVETSDRASNRARAAREHPHPARCSPCSLPTRHRRRGRGHLSAQKPGVRGLAGAPPHKTPAREAGREATGRQGVLPHRLPTRLPRADLREGGQGPQGGTSRTSRKTARNTPAVPPSLPPSPARTARTVPWPAHLHHAPTSRTEVLPGHCLSNRPRGTRHDHPHQPDHRNRAGPPARAAHRRSRRPTLDQPHPHARPRARLRVGAGSPHADDLVTGGHAPGHGRCHAPVTPLVTVRDKPLTCNSLPQPPPP